jgi:cob(I)alamin adenosyltransferase
MLYYLPIWAAVYTKNYDVEIFQMKKGLLTIFTGKGKGKTTAALGMAVRAIGHDWKVCLIQFVKGTWKTGEWDALKVYGDHMVIHVKGEGFIYNSDDIERAKGSAREAWQLAKEILESQEYHLIILDELTYLLNYEMIDEGDVCKALRTRRKDLHVVVTGRDAPDCLIEMADMVTEMIEIKHPMQSGMKAQKGIEF